MLPTVLSFLRQEDVGVLICYMGVPLTRRGVHTASSSFREGDRDIPMNGDQTFSKIEIQSADLILQLLPTLGASIANFSTKIEGNWVEIMRHTPDQIKSSSDTSSFLMAPYPNRIRDGKFNFEGREYQLRFPEKHAIHGDVRNRPWQIKNQDASSCTLRFSSSDFSDINFPFKFSAEQRFSLDSATLRIECSIKNEDKIKIPVGCGFHPYFQRNIMGNSENVELQFTVLGEYPFKGDLPLPSGDAIAVPAEHDFSKLRKLDQELDHCFAGWRGPATIFWPQSKLKLEMRASDNTKHLVIYSPPGKDFFALEPQTQMIDGVNFLNSVPNNGVCELASGESFGMWVEFTISRTVNT